MNREQIIEKVQKLLALATSPNEHEAKSAARMAHELLTKYNLSIEAVEAHKVREEYEAVDKDMNRGACPMEDKYVLSVLQRYFYVKVITHTVYQRAPWGGGARQRMKKYKFTLVGRKHNVQIARYVYDFLFRSFRSAFIDFCKKNGALASQQNAKARRSYYHGLTMGLMQQLEDSVQKALAKEQAVALRDDPNIDAFLEGEFPNMKEAKPSKEQAVNRAIAYAGFVDGNQMKIAVGLNGSAGEQPQVGQTLVLEDKT